MLPLPRQIRGVYPMRQQELLYGFPRHMRPSSWVPHEHEGFRGRYPTEGILREAPAGRSTTPQFSLTGSSTREVKLQKMNPLSPALQRHPVPEVEGLLTTERR